MAFSQKTWTDRIAEYITRRTLTKTDGTTEVVTVERNEGEVSQEGDAFSASNMNDLEERIASEFTSVNNNLSQLGDVTTLVSDCTSTSEYLVEVPSLSAFSFIFLSMYYTGGGYAKDSLIPTAILKTDGTYHNINWPEYHSLAGFIKYSDDTHLYVGTSNYAGGHLYIYGVK